MSVSVNDRVSMGDIANLPLKSNLLKLSPIPEIIDANGLPFTNKSGNITEVVGGHMMCDRRHVQLDGKLPFTVTYTIESEKTINKLLVATFTASVNYGYGRYEVYLGDNKDSLYSPENYIAEYDRRNVFDPKDLLKGTAQIFTLPQPRTAKFFGIKFTHGCALDTVVRLDFAGVFSPEAEAERIHLTKYGMDALEDANIETKDGVTTYDIGAMVALNTLIVEDETAVVETSVDGEKFAPFNTCYTAEKAGEETIFVHSGEYTARFIRSKKDNIIGVFSNKNIVEVTNEVINEDFLGAGTNVLPFQLMEESTNAFGYDPEFMKLEYDAIRKLDPKIIRVWFQNDWFQLAPDEYDFNLPKMQQFLEYMEIFRELGTEIELDFSWVVGRRLHSWYTIPEIPDQGRSAPRDTKQFARSVVAALKFLTDEKGLNVKYLTVANEPENGNFAVTPDNNIELKKKYLAKTLIDIDSELKKAGMRDRFEIWGPECSAATKDRDWLKDMYEMAGDVIDCYTKHIYSATNDEILNINIPFYFESTKNTKKIGLTEFGCNMPTFRKSTVGALISAANGGLSVALHWCLTNSVLPDPFCGPFDENICLYRNDEFKNNELYIEPICSEYGPAMKYVPAHCRVLKTNCSNPLDARVCVFEKDGDYTIIAETNQNGNRELVIDLGAITNKPFKMLSFNISNGERPTEIIPELSPVSTENGIIKVKLEPAHTMYLFTTVE